MGDPTPLELISAALDRLHEMTERRFDATDKKIDGVSKDLEDSNKRLGKVEIWQARWDGARFALKWLPELVTATCASAAGGLFVLLFFH